MGLRDKLPPVGTILAWLGVLGTILGIIGFFIDDLPGVVGGQPEGLTEAEIVGTLSALQDNAQAAEFQLTQIFLQNQQANNQATQNAFAQQQADFQATVDAVRAEQEVVVNTQNAIAAMTAAVEAEQATANAAATQVAEAATATANWLAQITPTPTPLPTTTPIPAPVADYRSLVAASVAPGSEGRLEFTVQTEATIPENPPDGLTYVWSLDTDRNPETGLGVNDIGVDIRVAARYEDETWVGSVRSVQEDGTLNEPSYFLSIEPQGNVLVATLSPQDLLIPPFFNWVARAELGGEAYSFVPEDGHFAFGPGG